MERRPIEEGGGGLKDHQEWLSVNFTGKSQGISAFLIQSTGYT